MTFSTLDQSMNNVTAFKAKSKPLSSFVTLLIKLCASVINSSSAMLHNKLMPKPATTGQEETTDLYHL